MKQWVEREVEGGSGWGTHVNPWLFQEYIYFRSIPRLELPYTLGWSLFLWRILGLSYWLILPLGKIFASKLGTGEIDWLSLTGTRALSATCWIGSVASVFLAYICPMNEMWWGCLAPALVFSAWPCEWESRTGRETLVLSVTFIRNWAPATLRFSLWLGPGERGSPTFLATLAHIWILIILLRCQRWRD